MSKKDVEEQFKRITNEEEEEEHVDEWDYMKSAIMSSAFDDLVEERARQIGMMYYNEWAEKEMLRKMK